MEKTGFELPSVFLGCCAHTLGYAMGDMELQQLQGRMSL